LLKGGELRRKIPDHRLRFAIEKLASVSKVKRPLPKRFDWDKVTAIGYDMGKADGKALAKRYTTALERSWGSKPILPKDIAVACAWMEETALEEAFSQPTWNSLSLSTQFYPPHTPEGHFLDTRIWQEYERGLVEGLRERLLKYGCEKYLRFVDMSAFVRYTRADG
jgi:hypothetical protein